jgi:hypothetical protein
VPHAVPQPPNHEGGSEARGARCVWRAVAERVMKRLFDNPETVEAAFLWLMIAAAGAFILMALR